MWVVSIVRSSRELRDFLADKSTDETLPGLFIRAQAEYLRGNWYRVEHLLSQLLGQRDQDAEARLLMATMFRTTSRFAEARQQLRQLGQLERASEWKMEIEREWNLVELREQRKNMVKRQKSELSNQARAA